MNCCRGSGPKCPSSTNQVQSRDAYSVHFSHTCSAANEHDLFALDSQMERARWRTSTYRARDKARLSDHEAWKRSDLNQRQYCEAEGIPLKAFGNWRAQFKAEPQPPVRKLLYRRRPLSLPVSPPLSPLSSPVTYPSSQPAGPIVPRLREGH